MAHSKRLSRRAEIPALNNSALEDSKDSFYLSGRNSLTHTLLIIVDDVLGDTLEHVLHFLISGNCSSDKT